MFVNKTAIEGVLIIEPQIFPDGRGCFFESFSERVFSEKVHPVKFVQDNESVSRKGVLRGLHYQIPPYAQSKLVRVVRGAVLDVAVDMRKGSPTFGKYVSVELSGDNRRQLFIPRGFAHGFLALENETVLQYKCDNYYAPGHEGGLIFNDPQVGICWGMAGDELILSEKDRANPGLDKAILFNYGGKLY